MNIQTAPHATIADRIAAVRAAIAEAAHAADRDPAEITLMAVTKVQPRESVLEAIAAGITTVGENYAQEAKEKYVDLPPVETHFIGHVQTNKAKLIAPLFDVVQSVDRLDAGKALARIAAGIGKQQRVLVQLNISPAERFGCAPEDAVSLANALRQEGLIVEGVMAVGPITSDDDVLRKAFEVARDQFHRIGGTTLSIGMSGDLRAAIAAGSTMVRIGSAIFGPRPPKESPA
jgi:pyridoxal phosphate enzyme (YggS family)